MELFPDEIQVHIAFGDALIENLLRMNERIHKRLPVGFVQEVLQAFNGRRISEREAMELLGLRRSRLHQLRKRWLLSSQIGLFVCGRGGKMPFMCRARRLGSGSMRSSDTFDKRRICFVGSLTLPFWPSRRRRDFIDPSVVIAYGCMP